MQWWHVKHSGWKRALTWLLEPAPDAVTMRPEMGRAQLEHDTVGME